MQKAERRKIESQWREKRCHVTITQLEWRGNEEGRRLWNRQHRMSYTAECDYTDWLSTGSPLPKMDRGWGESHGLAGNAVGRTGATKGDNKRENKLVGYCSSRQCQFFCSDVHIWILSSQGGAGAYWPGNRRRPHGNRWTQSHSGRHKKQPPTDYTAAFIRYFSQTLQ